MYVLVWYKATPVRARDIARSEYKSTTSMSCDLLKLHKLIENGGDNKKRKEMILTILGGGDLLSMLNGTRSKPIATSTNPTGFTERRIIVEANGEDAILNADDVFAYLHDSRRLYIAITIAISESLQHQREMEFFFGISPSNIFLGHPTMTSLRHRIGFAAST